MISVNNIESNVRSYSRSFPVVFEKARGSELIDQSGRRYIDFFSGAGALNYGHNNAHLKKRLIEYIEADGVMHSLDMSTTSKRHFLSIFNEHILKPRNLQYRVQFTGPSGASAVEAALKLARKVTGRRGIVSFTNGFHGMSAGALSVTANSYYKQNDFALDSSSFMPYEGYMGSGFETMDLIEKYFEDPASGVQPPAAFIVETIQAEGGIRACSKPWMQRLSRLAKRIGSLLIIDEIQTGCGRCGDFFGFEALDVVPDVVTLSKSIGGLGLPLAMVLIRPEYDEWAPGEHNGTFRGNNLAFVAGAAAIEIYWHDDAFSIDLRRKEGLLKTKLEALRHLVPGGTIRGRGMLHGIDCITSELAQEIAETAFRNGLVIERCGARNEVIKLLPALTITDELLMEGVHLLERACSTTVHQYALPN